MLQHDKDKCFLITKYNLQKNIFKLISLLIITLAFHHVIIFIYLAPSILSGGFNFILIPNYTPFFKYHVDKK